jgi:hypothetical protein
MLVANIERQTSTHETVAKHSLLEEKIMKVLQFISLRITCLKK